jgi:hypothetical protein
VTPAVRQFSAAVFMMAGCIKSASEGASYILFPMVNLSFDRLAGVFVSTDGHFYARFPIV